MKSKRTYFPGLNALRFFAATLVIFHHLEQYKFWSDQPSLWGQAFIDALGHKPVGLFFVLSGFLITHLLLEENRDHQSLNIHQFYLKRVFRIWPLYFVIVIVTLIVVPIFSNIAFSNLPSPNNSTVLISLVLILPNLLRISFPTLIGGNQLWSVGIEEQFYLIWPLLVKRFQNNIIGFLFSFLFLKLAVHMLMLYGLSLINAPWLVKLEVLYALFPVEQMAIGALGASFVFYKKDKILKYMRSPIIGIMALFLIFVSSFFHIDNFLIPACEALFFIIIIYQITTNENIYKLLENRMLYYLGSISYGIYMWHTIAITISITTMRYLGWNSSLIVCLLSLAITFFLSHFSFKYLEKPAQELREYFIKPKEVSNIRIVKNA